jgi:predicted nucleotidyltransferase
VDKQAAPSLLPILRSQQQGEILALLLGDPDLELSLTEIAAPDRHSPPFGLPRDPARRTSRPGHVTQDREHQTCPGQHRQPVLRRPGRILTRAFGVPAVLAKALRDVSGITAAYIYGSWAARHEGQTGQRPVGDIDVLVLGEPDRDQLYAALSIAEERLARPVQVTIRNRTWLESGSGAFHDTIISRPLVKLAVPDG